VDAVRPGRRAMLLDLKQTLLLQSVSNRFDRLRDQTDSSHRGEGRPCRNASARQRYNYPWY
jgi:hypothetical protein